MPVTSTEAREPDSLPAPIPANTSVNFIRRNPSLRERRPAPAVTRAPRCTCTRRGRLRHHPSTALASAPATSPGDVPPRHDATCPSTFGTDTSCSSRSVTGVGRGGVLLTCIGGGLGNRFGGGQGGKRRWNAQIRAGPAIAILPEGGGGNQAPVDVGLWPVDHHVDDQARDRPPGRPRREAGNALVGVAACKRVGFLRRAGFPGHACTPPALPRGRFHPSAPPSSSRTTVRAVFSETASPDRGGLVFQDHHPSGSGHAGHQIRAASGRPCWPARRRRQPPGPQWN